MGVGTAGMGILVCWMYLYPVFWVHVSDQVLTRVTMSLPCAQGLVRNYTARGIDNLVQLTKWPSSQHVVRVFVVYTGRESWGRVLLPPLTPRIGFQVVLTIFDSELSK